jgi:co-chaperonin GroES (HSP10)
MAKNDRKSNKLSNDFYYDDLSDSDALTKRSAHGEDSNTFHSKRIRRIHPLGLRIVARIVKDSNVTDSGLYLPEGAKEAGQESFLAEVIEVASTLDSRTEEETNVSGIPLGAMVLIPKSAGTKVPWDDSLRVVDTREVLAMVDEISLV